MQVAVLVSRAFALWKWNYQLQCDKYTAQQTYVLSILALPCIIIIIIIITIFIFIISFI